MTISYVPLRVRVSLLPRQWGTTCESRSTIFSSTKFGRSTTLQRNYSQLWWETVSFSFIIVRYKYNRYCREASTLSARFHWQSYEPFSNCTQAVQGSHCTSQETAKTKCLLGDCCCMTSMLLQELLAMSSSSQQRCQPWMASEPPSVTSC